MNLTQKALILLALGLVGAALLAQGPQPGLQTTTPKREARMEKQADAQQKRIAQGLAGGQLTAQEAARLEQREARIDRSMSRVQADGAITKREARRIQDQQSKASARIHQQKHDPQVRK